MTNCVREIFKKLESLKQVLSCKNSEMSQDLFLEELDLRTMQKNLAIITRTVDHLKQLRLLEIGLARKSMERTPTEVNGLSFRRNHPEFQTQLRKMQSLNTKKWSPANYVLYQNGHCPTEESQEHFFDRKCTDYSQYSRNKTLHAAYRRATETGVAAYKSHRTPLEYQETDPMSFLHCKSNSKIMIEDHNHRSARYPDFTYVSPRANAYTTRSPVGPGHGYRSVRTQRAEDCIPFPAKSRTPEGKKGRHTKSPSAAQYEFLRANPLVSQGRIAFLKPERKQASFAMAVSDPIQLNQRPGGYFSPKQSMNLQGQQGELKKVLASFKSPKKTMLWKGAEKIRQILDERKKNPDIRSPLARKVHQISSSSQVRFEPKTEIIQTPPTVPNYKSKKMNKPTHSMDSNLHYLIHKSRSSHLGTSPINFTPSIGDAKGSVDLHLKEMSVSDHNRSSHQTIKHGAKD